MHSIVALLLLALTGFISKGKHEKSEWIWIYDRKYPRARLWWRPSSVGVVDAIKGRKSSVQCSCSTKWRRTTGKRENLHLSIMMRRSATEELHCMHILHSHVMLRTTTVDSFSFFYCPASLLMYPTSAAHPISIVCLEIGIGLSAWGAFVGQTVNNWLPWGRH